MNDAATIVLSIVVIVIAFRLFSKLLVCSAIAVVGMRKESRSRR